MKLLMMLLVLVSSFSTVSAASEEGDGAAMAFDTYYMVFLKRVANAEQISPEQVAEIQKAHLAHLFGQMAKGQIKVAGPFDAGPDGELRGVVIYPGEMAQEEVTRLANADPAVIAGRLRVEVHKWWVPKGTITFNNTPIPEAK